MEIKTTWQKYEEILSSPRFHQILAIAVLQGLRHYGIIDDYIANTISTLLGASVTIGTVDRAGNTTVTEKPVLVAVDTNSVPVVGEVEQAQSIVDGVNINLTK